MGRGVFGAEMFEQKIEERVIEARRPNTGRPRK
jgi:hypothetical protein